MKHTPDNITELKENEVFIFGSNLNGHHLGGSAKLAYDKFGAIWGNGWGIQGMGHDFKSYAFPTLEFNMEKLSEGELKIQIMNLIMVVNWCPEKTFYLTKVGTGIASYSEDYMKSLFKKFKKPKNLIVPKGW